MGFTLVLLLVINIICSNALPRTRPPGQAAVPNGHAMNFPDDDSSPPTDRGSIPQTLLAVSVPFAGILMLAFGINLWLCRPHNSGENAGISYFACGRPFDKKQSPTLHADLLPYDRKYEMTRRQLHVMRPPGTVGCFGMVLRAEASVIVEGKATSRRVAVKMVCRNDSDEAIKALIAELKLLIHIGKQPHIVQLLGAITASIKTRKLYVITEFCELGNMEQFLRRSRDQFHDQLDETADNIILDSVADAEAMFISTDDMNDTQSTKSTARPTNTNDLMVWAHQAAIGMAYLEANNILHGQLRSRHCLLTGDRRLKIADFGLACALPAAAEAEAPATDVEANDTSDMTLAVRWMSIETLRDQRHSTATDVWSFGVMLWEFFSLAERPYDGVADAQLLPRLQVGHRMMRPPYATHMMFELMRECWLAEPKWRPGFKDIVVRLAGQLPSTNGAYERAKESSVVETPDDLMDVVPEADAPPPPVAVV